MELILRRKIAISVKEIIPNDCSPVFDVVFLVLKEAACYLPLSIYDSSF